MTATSPRERVVILGAGISGLTAAWALQKKGADVVIIDKQPHVGGWIQTKLQGDLLFEQGPRGFRPRGAGEKTLLLARELGLSDALIAADPVAKKRFVWYRGRLRQLPNHLIGFWRSPLTRGLPLTLWREWHTAKGNGEDESIDTFARRRFGGFVADTLMDALVSGVFAGDATQLSMQACFPKLWEMERKEGSITRALWRGRRGPQRREPDQFLQAWSKVPLVSFREGMVTLPRALEKQLLVTWRLGKEVRALRHFPDRVEVVLDGEIITADRVISALPATALAPLVHAGDTMAADLLASIRTVSLALVQVGFKRQVLPVQGFGYLIPTKEQQRVLGMEWDSAVFPQQNRWPEETRITAMMGGAHHPRIEQLGEDRLQAIALQALREHLGIHATPDVLAVSFAHNAIPQYAVGHRGKVASIRQHLKGTFPRLSLSGMSFDGVALNDCITLD